MARISINPVGLTNEYEKQKPRVIQNNGDWSSENPTNHFYEKLRPSLRSEKMACDGDVYNESTVR